MMSNTLASPPTRTRALFLRTASRMIWAARSGLVLASRLSNILASFSLSSPSAAVALRAIAVLTPPGWTAVTRTGWPAMSISWRSASVKPRTANLAAL